MTDHPFESILSLERMNHPGMTERDVFKLAMQAVYGGDHLLRDRKRFQRELSLEWQSLSKVPPCVDPILQVIDPEGLTARFHLNAGRTAGFELTEISDFLTGQALKNADRSGFMRLWNTILENAIEWDSLLDESVLRSMPAGQSPTHHSESYGFASYRICNDITSSRSRCWLEANGIGVRFS